MKYRSLSRYKYQTMKREIFLLPLPPDPPIVSSGEWLMIRNQRLEIRKGYCWDGPSGPSIDTKTFMRGSLAHDALYQLLREGLLDESYRELADQVLRDICLEDGMSRFRAWYVHAGVSFGAGFAAKRGSQKTVIREAP